MNTPDTKTINADIAAICQNRGIAMQTRVTGTGTYTRYVDMPGRTVDRVTAAQEINAKAAVERATGHGSEAMIYTIAAQIVAKIPKARTAK